MNLTHPYADLDSGRWMRGNLHTHTTLSDGQSPIEDVVADYASRGYDFLSITDHDMLTDPEVLDACAAAAGDMVLVPGNEISANGPHIVHVGSDRVIEPLEDRQEVIRQINATAGISIVAHPNAWNNFEHCSLANLQEWQDYQGIEILNTLGWLGGDAYALQKWDLLLCSGRRVWGYANDDAHNPDMVAKAWNVAYVTDPSPGGIVDALARGAFYASCGVTINDIKVEGSRIRIETEDAERIVAISNAADTYTHRIGQVDDRVMEIDFVEDKRFIRFECWGKGERFAWTQPIFCDDV